MISSKSRFAMLRHLSSLPKRSTSTRSERPASFRCAASTEPINPPPPVITNIRQSPELGRVLARFGPDRMDQAGCRAPLDQIDQHDPAARRLDVLGADDGLDRIVAAFDKH